MIVECHLCEAKVDAILVGQYTWRDDEDPDDFHAYLLECPRCHTGLVGGGYNFEGEPLTRLWPRPEKFISYQVPDSIRHSLDEARACFKAGAYNASTVMAGRALEGICRHFGTTKVYLGPGIRELHERGIIDSRLTRWAGALQQARNLSAHASGELVSKRDAEDLLDFLNAICDYVFVLTKKFEDYIARKGEAKDVDAQLQTPLPESEES